MEKFDKLKDIKTEITVSLGKAKLSFEEIANISEGSVLELNKIAGSPMDIYAGDKHIAIGEAVVVNEKFGVRVIKIL